MQFLLDLQPCDPNTPMVDWWEPLEQLENDRPSSHESSNNGNSLL